MRFKNFLKRNVVLIFVIFVGVLASRDLFIPGYFPMHDDLQMMRQLQMDKCFRDGQIPCRWVPDMGYGYGYPLFNFYPPLPYLVGEVIKTVGFPFTATARMTFMLSIVLSGITMYFLAREFWGKAGGLISSVFYVWAPYHAVDVYVRGAMNESWALVWFPLIFWVSYKLITATGPAGLHPRPTSSQSLRALDGAPPRPSPVAFYVVVLSLSWSALLLSHNVMVLIFAPVFALWCLLWLWRSGAWYKIPQLLVSGLWALGLAAFFTIPVILEQKLVQIETLTKGFYEYFAHYVSINQLFLSRFWGYGPSLWGIDDGMPFPTGHFHWVLAVLIGVLGVLGLLGKRKINSSLLLTTYYLLLIGFAATFMTHARSTPIWQALPFLSIVQFPWRFLTLVVFSFSLLAGAIVIFLKGKDAWLWRLTTVLIIAVIAWNFNFFRVERVGPVTDEEKFSGEAWRLQQTAGIYDYLPKTAKIAPQSARKEAIEIVNGEAVIGEVKQGTNWLATNINVTQESTIRINILYFPGWRVFIDEKMQEIKILEDDELGRMSVVIPQGEHTVEARLFNTPLRTTGNVISFFSWAALITLPWWRRKIKV